MNTIVLYEDSVVIPSGISDLEAFRRWVHSEDFPEAGRICFTRSRRQCLKSPLVRLVEGEERKLLELAGTPDTVLEIVSSSSVEKDTVTLLICTWERKFPNTGWSTLDRP